jgi:hypothetical protein
MPSDEQGADLLKKQYRSAVEECQQAISVAFLLAFVSPQI